MLRWASVPLYTPSAAPGEIGPVTFSPSPVGCVEGGRDAYSGDTQLLELSADIVQR